MHHQRLAVVKIVYVVWLVEKTVYETYYHDVMIVKSVVWLVEKTYQHFAVGCRVVHYQDGGLPAVLVDSHPH